MKNIIKYSFIYLSCLLIFNCASIGLPGGGPSDENSPYLITSEIFPVSNLNIDSKQITITTMPMAYSYGLSIINSHLQAGSKIIVNNM